MLDNSLIKETLNSVKTIAMVGVSSTKDEKKSVFIKRRPSIIVMQYLKEFGYKVLLSGAGGDDLFSGYRRHQALNWEPFFNYTPTFFMQSMQYFSSMLPNNYSTLRRTKKILRNATKTPLERMAGYHEWLPLKLNCGLFSDEIKFNIGDYKPSKILIDSLEVGGPIMLSTALELSVKFVFSINVTMLGLGY